MDKYFLVCFLVMLSLLSCSVNALVCSGLYAYNGTSADVSSVLNSCINSVSPGGVVELPAGKYYLNKTIFIDKAITLRTIGKNASMPRCAFGQNHDCAELIATPDFGLPYPSNWQPSLFFVRSNDTSVDHIVFNGNGEARPATDHLYYGVVWGCSRCNFTNNVITRTALLCALCASGNPNPDCSAAGRDIKDRVIVSNNLFALNGLHESGPNWSGARWSDGFTAWDYSNSVFAGNEFVDNTDVDFDLGGCQNCTIQNNSIRHTGSCRRASFAALLLGGWPGTPQNALCTTGNYTGTVFSNNTINCGENKMCFFGLGLGAHEWYISSVYGGSVHNNTVVNAQQGVTIDDVTDMEVYNNLASGSAGSNYWIGKDTRNLSTSKDTLHATYANKNWDLYYSKWGNVSFMNGCSASENYAVFVSQSVPATMTAGQTYTLSVTMRNRGSTTWTAAGNYRLGSQDPQDNHIWNGGRVGLSSAEYVEPIDQDTKTFTFTVMAPATPGVYDFQWRMLQEYVEWFGEYTPDVRVNVTPLKIACIGDSITYGTDLANPQTQAFYAKLGLKGNYSVQNAGIPGDYSKGVLARISDVTGKGNYATAVLIGTNDMSQGISTFTDIPAYYQTVNSIVSALKQDRQKVILSTIPPCYDTTYRHCQPGNQTEPIERNKVIRRVSYEKGVCYADIFSGVFQSDYNSSLFVDSVHPNAAAHGLIADNYYAALNDCKPFDCAAYPSDCYDPQALKISGRVAGNDGQGIPKASIELCGAASDPITDDSGNWTATLTEGTSYCARVASLPAGWTSVNAINNNACHANYSSYEFQIAGQDKYVDCSAANEGSWDISSDTNLDFVVLYPTTSSTTTSTSTTISSSTSTTSTSTPTTASTTSTTLQCIMPGNYPAENGSCNDVSLIEVVAAINQWATGGFDLGDVIDLIDSWVDPMTYPPH